MGRGLLGTAASRAADLALLIEMAMGLILVLGAVLARKRLYRAHAWCQTAAVLLNLAVITRYMVPIFRREVIASLPAGLGDFSYLLAAAHGATGAMAELFAVYILLAAGTNYLPRRLRFVHYASWMRSALVLWWLTLLLGLATYLNWYLIPLYR